MMPMGWNQLRQVRVPGIQQHMTFEQQPQMMVPNQPTFHIYQPPMMPQPHPQIFPPQMMGNYTMQGPQMMMRNSLKPPEPEGPPPPSPPAPLPNSEIVPPLPPDDVQEWWVAEMKKLANNSQRQELDQLVHEKWFRNMPRNHQIDCWQRKLNLLNAPNKDIGKSQQMTPVISAPAVSAPLRMKPQFLQTGDIERDLEKAKKEEENIRQQVATFEKQYGEWKKQFDDWKDKHKSHPNKEQFAQYENQWMTWQKQMADQKNEYDNNLLSVREKIQNLEQQKAEMQNHGYNAQHNPGGGFQGQMYSNQRPPRFPQNQGQYGFTGGPQNCQGSQLRPGFNAGQGFNANQNLQYNNQSQRFRPPFLPPPDFDNNQGPGFIQRPRSLTPGNIADNRFQHPTPGSFHEGQVQRPRLSGPRGGGQSISNQWRQPGSRFRGPVGSRFGNTRPPYDPEEEDYGEAWGEEEEYHEEGNLQSPFSHGQALRGPHPGFGVRGRGARGGPRNQFDNHRRPPRPVGRGEELGFRGARPRFSGQQGRFPGPRGPRPPFNRQLSQGQFNEDSNTNDINFYDEEEDNIQESGLAEDTTTNTENVKVKQEWNVSSDMAPMAFGKDENEKRNSRYHTFNMQDIKKGPTIKQEMDDNFTPAQKRETSKIDAKWEKDRMKFTEDIDPKDDYSHYMTDEYASYDVKPKARGRGLLETPKYGRGGGSSVDTRGRRGRGASLEWDRSNEYGKNMREDVKPAHTLLKEKEEFNKDNKKRDQLEDEKAGFFSKSEAPTSSTLSFQKVSPASSPFTSINAEAIMQKAKELSNLDIKNLLSAVKSVKNTPQLEEGQSGIQLHDRDLELSTGQIEDVEAAFVARERHYDRLARDFDNPTLRRLESRSLATGSRLTESDLVATNFDPISLGLHGENLLVQEYQLLNPAMREPRLRDPLLDPLLQDSYLERELLIREVREMRQREAARKREVARREMELRQALSKPILQAQKIVETIDYSHGLNKKDADKMQQDEAKDIIQRQGPVVTEFGSASSEKEPLLGDRPQAPFHERSEAEVFDKERRRFPPISMDERMRMQERGIPPPGMDERMRQDHGFPPQMDQRIVREREWPTRSPEREGHRLPYNPDSRVIVAERQALEKHWKRLDQERESVERRRNSMERRRNSLERTRASKEREEERRERERSLERLRKMERELKERERMLNERERRLKTPPRRARDKKDTPDWRTEGSRNRTVRRSRSPPGRRFEEERPSRLKRDSDRERRYRSPSPVHGRENDEGGSRGRSPQWNRRDRSPRHRDTRRSPDYTKSHPLGGRDRRRFTSPSGSPSKTRSPVGIRPVHNIIKAEPVVVRIEDLLNDPARQQRPKRIVILLRGLPGSGKSHIAKLIRDRESAKGVTPRVLGLDDYFMVENEKFEKDPDTGRIVKRKVHEYEYEPSMEPTYRESLLKAFRKTLEDGYFSFVIVDSINDKVSYFSDFWTAAKKCVFEVYVAELTADVHVCVKRNVHKRKLSEIQDIAKGWEETPPHMIRLDVRQMLQDSEIQEVEMGDISDEEAGGDVKKEKMTPEQLAGVPQSKWELMEANERLDKLDGIKKKKLTSSQQDMAEFLSVTDDYVRRNSAPGKKRVRWADIEEKSTQRRLREVGFVVGNTDWSRLVDGDTHADAALNRTKFI